jgi:tetratricopeptide (TPR) repeat protein
LGLFGVAPLTQFDLGPNKNMEEKDFRHIAKNSDAAIIVTGELYFQEMNLVIHSRLYDALKQKLLPSPDPVSGQIEDFSEVIEKLSDRLKSAVMSTHDPRVEMWQKISPYIPKYEALLEFKRGMELSLSNEFLQASRHFDRAVEIDPAYLLAHLSAFWIYSSAYYFSVGEQYLEKMEHYLDKIEKFTNLSPGEKLSVESIKAYQEGDNENGYLIEKQLEALAPGTTYSYWLANSALGTNRPQAAVEALRRLDPNSIYIDCNVCYWDTLCKAHHMLGNYKKELELAQQALRQFPQEWQPLWLKGRALSALGRLDEVQNLIEEILVKPMTSDWFPADLISGVGVELKAHGYDEAAAEMYEQSLLWLKQRSLKEELSDDMKTTLAWTLSETQNWDEAEAVFRDLIESNPENLDYLGGLGIVMARRGNREEALRISEQLKNWDKPYSFGNHTFWQATIAANFGEKVRAISLLQTALQQGFSYRFLYCNVTLEPLWDFPPFVELIKPRD